MDKLNVLIIDDEQSARENLRAKILEYSDNFSIAGEAENISIAKDLLLELDVDAVFLDISMPNGTGFDLLNSLDAIDFDVIFVTAYNRFAIQAFKYFAIGYILKPIDITELHAVLSHLIDKKKVVRSQDLSKFLQFISNEKNVPLLAIPVEYGFEFIETSNILYLEADEGYAKIFVKDGKVLLSSKSLGYFSKLLDESLFKQIHRSYIINLSYLRKYHKVGFVTMDNGAEIPVSKLKRAEFRGLFK